MDRIINILWTETCLKWQVSHSTIMQKGKSCRSYLSGFSNNLWSQMNVMRMYQEEKKVKLLLCYGLGWWSTCLRARFYIIACYPTHKNPEFHWIWSQTVIRSVFWQIFWKIMLSLSSHFSVPLIGSTKMD